MAVKSKDEIMNAIKERLKDDTSDSALGLIEDINDTYDSLSQQVTEAGDWKIRYETNDKEWREKYKERFFSGGSPEPQAAEPQVPAPDEPDKPLNYEDLFKQE